MKDIKGNILSEGDAVVYVGTVTKIYTENRQKSCLMDCLS